MRFLKGSAGSDACPSKTQKAPHSKLHKTFKITYIFLHVVFDIASQITCADNGSMFSYNRQLNFCQYTCTVLMGKVLESPRYQSILCASTLALPWT